MEVVKIIPITSLEEESEPPSLTYCLDFRLNRIVGMVDGIEAVNQFIYKVLRSPRFRCLIYDNQYGSELKEMIIAGDVTPEYVEAEIPRLVRDALMIDSRITDVHSFTIHQEGENIYISFMVDSIFGNTVIKEVM